MMAVRIGGVLGLALMCAAGEAAADAVIYDADRYREVETEIEVRGVAALADVVLVVYPYPCALWGPFQRFEEARAREPSARLELDLWGGEEARGYLVVAEGERFDSASNYEGPYVHCYFYGLPRADFPVEGGAIARLEAMTAEARWQLFTRDPSVLRTGVRLAMDGLVTGPRERSRLVSYEARREGDALTVEATRWTWTLTNGKTRVQDPRTLSAEALALVEPHADPSDDAEAPYFAGRMIERAESAARTEAPALAEGPGAAAEEPIGVAAAPATTPPEGAPRATATARPASAAKSDRAWFFGVLCLVVAGVAALLLRRGRG